MPKKWVALITLSFVLITGTALAQTSSIKPNFYSSTDVIEKWNAVKKGTSREEVVDLLSKEGWKLDAIDPALSVAGKYDLYSAVVAPGVKNYLAVPQGNDVQPVQFQAIYHALQRGYPGKTSVVQAGLFDKLPTKEEIKKAILDGIQASIDAICEMRARPREIRAKANAFDIVEVEATWDSAEVCGR